MMTEKEFQEYMAERFVRFFRSEIIENEKFKREFISGLEEAQYNIEQKLKEFYDKFADLEDISLQEAKRVLTTDEIKKFQMDVWEYIKLNNLEELDEELKKRIEEASIAYRSSRLDKINAEVDLIIANAYKGLDTNLENYLVNSYLNNYYHTAYEIFKGFGVGVSFEHVNTLQLKQVLKIPWTKDHFNYVERLKINQATLRKELPQILEETIIEGLSYTEATERFSKRLKTSITNAQTLVVTEHAYVSTLAQFDMFEELGVEEYQIVATLDTKTSEICQEQDHKIYKFSEMEAGTTAPPFHPNCRTTTAPYMDLKKYDENYTPIDRAARNKDGKTYYVPGDWNYEKWYKAEYGQARKIISDDEIGFLLVEDKKSGLKIYKNNSNTRANKLSIHKTPRYAEAGDIIDKIDINTKEVVQRAFYDNNGQKFKEIDLVFHGNKKYHEIVPHYHLYDFSKKGDPRITPNDNKLNDSMKSDISDIFNEEVYELQKRLGYQ